ncbi:Two pore potassium channel c [Carex littledalei]|uniref:Two pore potassium channel c n=1 Tax=Carex littledalei TaxID=544730 RepID=A0A833S1Z0_9POAL|nr:Two pore potassium channel c [Carex littledalei]
MAVLDELIRSIELWVRASRKHEENAANPDLDPVLLISPKGGVVGGGDGELLLVHSAAQHGKSEFVVYKLKEMGKITVKDVMLICEQKKW